MLIEHSSALLPVYPTFPLRAVSGHGSWLVDENGDEWLDAYGGHAVATSGHSHPDVVAAIAEQAARLLFYSTAVPHAAREKLAEAIVTRTPAPLAKVFFCNSGAEANENLLSLARSKTRRSRVVSLRGGWHGRTAATLACTDGDKYEAAALLAGMPLSHKVKLNDLEGLAAAVDNSTAAILLEPVQGFNGARTCTPEFLAGARAIADEQGAVLLFDEVQCGSGRLGTFTAAEHFGITPDALSLAKGLAAGMPIGAVITTESLVEDIKVGDLGSTFGGGPVPCAAALANIGVMERENLLHNVREVGGKLACRCAGLDAVEAVHGRGFLLGLQLDRPAKKVQKDLWGHRILTGTSTDPNTLRLLPPLSLSEDEADLLFRGISEVLA
jgi:acetylornithine/N-succinyldiaminopimelate aminotransferase